MNTTTRSISFIAATAATFAFTACGAEIPAPAQEIFRGTQGSQPEAPGQPTRTAPSRQDFDDEFGTPSIRPRKARDDWKGSGNRIDFGDGGQ